MPERALEIQRYDAWMLPQVVRLFVEQYGGGEAIEQAAFERFFEHPYQRERSCRFVAIDGETVAGFQSYFYWPYRYEGRAIPALQSGRSLVSPAYRGRGVFQSLLGGFDSMRGSLDAKVLVGFPVEQSFGSFLRNGWSNPLNLAWYVRVIHPLSFFRKPTEALAPGHLREEPNPVNAVERRDVISLSRDRDFVEWRHQCSKDTHYWYFDYAADGARAGAELKLNQRNRICEIVIGDFETSVDDPRFVHDALRALVRAIRKYRSITIASIALNEHCRDTSLLHGLRRCGFRKIKRTIHFIAKDMGSGAPILEPTAWRVLRRDIDTW